MSTGAVIASRAGWFAWWTSVLAGDDDTFRREPYFSRDPECARIYSRRESAERAARRIESTYMFPVAVVDLVSLDDDDYKRGEDDMVADGTIWSEETDDGTIAVSMSAGRAHAWLLVCDDWFEQTHAEAAFIFRRWGEALHRQACVTCPASEMKSSA